MRACPIHYEADSVLRLCYSPTTSKSYLVLVTVVPTVVFVLLVVVLILCLYFRYVSTYLLPTYYLTQRARKARKRKAKPAKKIQIHPRKTVISEPPERNDQSDILSSERQLRPSTRESQRSREHVRSPASSLRLNTPSR